MTDTSKSGGARPLDGKVCLIMGVANKWSIAYAIGEAMRDAGATLALTFLDDRTKRDVETLIADQPEARTYQCNVESDDDLDALGAALQGDFGRVDSYVHSVGFAPLAELKGSYLETSREGFRIAHNISVYSLVATAQRVVPLMPEGGSIMTMTYLGADRAFPRYNVMGVAKAALEASVRYLAADLGEQRIRVNAISAGPIKSAAARGIPGFSEMLKHLSDRAPIKAEFGAKQVADVAVFLASDGSAAITGETIFVDNGYHMMGM